MIFPNLFRRPELEAEFLHVQQLLDAQHDSVSAVSSELLLFVTQGQAEPQVQFGAADVNGTFHDFKQMIDHVETRRLCYTDLLMVTHL